MSGLAFSGKMVDITTCTCTWCCRIATFNHRSEKCSQATKLLEDLQLRPASLKPLI